MKPFDIFIAYIDWRGGGKRRPVLVLSLNDKIVTALRITSQYENKSDRIKSNYFKIKNWAQAGLNKQSYIDTGSKREVSRALIGNPVPIGKLTERDKKNLIDFLSK